jgi:hypothetical protein
MVAKNVSHPCWESVRDRTECVCVDCPLFQKHREMAVKEMMQCITFHPVYPIIEVKGC